MEPHLTKLKTIDNNTITVCYGESPIQLGTMPFYNYKHHHTYAGDSTDTYVEDFNKNIKMRATVHIIKMRTKDWYPEYSGDLISNLPNVMVNNAESINDIQGSHVSGYPQGIEIPNFNDAQMSTNFINFIENLKSKKLAQLLSKIYYYLTHGNTPYNDVDFQTDYSVFNKFISVAPESDYVIYSDFDTFKYNQPAPTGNNYPQCVLIANVDTPIYRLPYVNTNPYSWINALRRFNTFPSMGIFFAGSASEYQDQTHIYWTTYKGV